MACAFLGVLAAFLLHGGWASAQSDVPDAPTDVAVYSIETQTLEVRWSTSDASSTTSFKIQWKSGSEEFDSSRQMTSDPATSIESDQSTSAGDRYVDIITGLTDGAEYTVRVIAANSSGDSDPSATATGTPASQPSQVREFFENEVVKIFESSSPWLRETWDYITTENVPVAWSTALSGGVTTLCTHVTPSKLRECDSYGVTHPRSYFSLMYGITHELAHVYTLANGVSATPGPLGIARLHFHVLTDGGTWGRSCRPIELFADAVTILTVGDRFQSTISYWSRCIETTDPASEQALAVVRSALSGQMPPWFADTYNDSNGNPDLARVWREVKAMGTANQRGYRETVIFQLRDAFGGYCDNQKAADSAFGSGVTRNPWRDGGCVPEAPTNASVTAVGSGKLSVSWQEPLGDGGSPLEGYKVQWKTGTQEYDSSRQVVVTDLTKIVQLQTISGLTNDESHTVRVLAYNHNGDGAAAELTATPTATDTTAPVLLLTRFDSRSVRLIWNEALDESSRPEASAFTVNVNGTSRRIYEVAVLGNAVWLSVEGTITTTDELTVRYVAPTGSGAAPVKDSSGNNAPGIATRAVRNDRIQIVITDPGPDKTYVLGRGFGGQDSIEATVTFSEPVIVSEVPELNLEVGGEARRASYHSGSGTNFLVFRYEVTEGETDSEGIWVRSSGNISKLRGPGVVRYASTKAVVPARLWSSIRTDYLVDAVRPTLVRANALANGNDVTLTWDKALDEDSAPTATGTVFFEVQDASDDSSREITAISVSGKVVTLTLSSAISATDRLTVSYGDFFRCCEVTFNDHEPLRDTLGNHAAVSSAAVSITQNANSAPEFLSSETGARRVDENTAAGRNIGSPIAATDADNDRRTYSISGTDAAFFEVVSSNGQLRTKGALDHESRESYSFTMSVTDGKDIHGNADTIVDDTITVTVIVIRGCINAGRPPCAPSRPTASSASDTSLRITWPTPRTPSGTSITGYELQYRESGSGGSWIPESVAGTDRSHTIENLIKDTTYEVQVRATNDSGEYGEWSQSGTGKPGYVPPPPPPPPPPPITGGGGGAPPPPANRSPSFPDGAATLRLVAENAVVGQYIGAPVAARDPDGDALAYTLSGADPQFFDVHPTTGQLRVKVPLDYETKSGYSVVVRVADGRGAGGFIAVTIAVTNVGLEGMVGRYDKDDNGVIDREEAIAAAVDYFNGVISKEEAIAVVRVYFAG